MGRKPHEKSGRTLDLVPNQRIDPNRESQEVEIQGRGKAT